MKKIIVENGKEVCYIQKKDIIAMTIFFKLKFPAQTFTTLQSFLDDKDGEQYLRFDKKEEVEFYKNEKWILDENFVDALSYDSIDQLGQIILDKMEQTRKLSGHTSNLVEKRKLDIKYFILDYQLKTLLDVLSKDKDNFQKKL